MNADRRTELREMLERFVRGEDQSLGFVRQIELLVSAHFRHAEFFEELSYNLAMYSPGGGDHLFDEKELVRELSFLLAGPLADQPDG